MSGSTTEKKGKAMAAKKTATPFVHNGKAITVDAAERLDLERQGVVFDVATPSDDAADDKKGDEK